jgi:hypothetical protein
VHSHSWDWGHVIHMVFMLKKLRSKTRVILPRSSREFTRTWVKTNLYPSSFMRLVLSDLCCKLMKRRLLWSRDWNKCLSAT